MPWLSRVMKTIIIVTAWLKKKASCELYHHNRLQGYEENKGEIKKDCAKVPLIGYSNHAI